MKRIFTMLFAFSLLQGLSQIPKLELVQFAQGLVKPLDIKHCNDSRLFVVEQAGRIKIIQNNGTVLGTPFMDIAYRVNSNGSEQGLLSMAFSPDYKNDGYFFICYIKNNGSGTTVLSRMSVDSQNPDKADTTTEVILLQFPQPYSNHNGCDLRFGPDGYLYASFGDGGSGGDPQQYGQNTNTFLGKILRIDPFNGNPYSVPQSNPFAGDLSKKQEIWAYGLRNPWRCAFDKVTGDYWIADVGQNIYEEINFQPAASAGGENYGWRCYEANSTYNTTGCSTNTNSFVYPVFQYTHGGLNGCSVTGGMVYRGAKHNNLFGKYLFTDICSGRIWCTEKTGQTFSTSVIGNYLTNQYSSFGENQHGDLFISALYNGRIYRIIDTSDCKPVAFLSLKDSIIACGGSHTLQTQFGDGLTYAWSLNGSAVLAATANSLSASQGGTYVVTVTNSLQCSSLATVVLRLNNATAVSITGLNDAYCSYEPVVTLVGTPPGGTFQVNGSLASQIDPAANPNSTLVVKYSYLNNQNCLSETVKSITVAECTGIDGRIASDRRVLVSPNPSEGRISVRIPQPIEGEFTIKISDLSGRLVYEEKVKAAKDVKTTTLDLSFLSNGVYVLNTGIGLNAPVRVGIQR